jgi:predicted tellurium resistance membrane protein TerC
MNHALIVSVTGFLIMTYVEVMLNVDNIQALAALEKEKKRRLTSGQIKLAVFSSLCIKILLLYVIGSLFQLNFRTAIFGVLFSPKDIILVAGGFYLISKAVTGITNRMDTDAPPCAPKALFKHMMLGVVVTDLVYSLDSIFAFTGLTDFTVFTALSMLVAAIIVTRFSIQIGQFVTTFPRVEILSLGLMILIGFNLFMNGMHLYIPKGYLHFAMFFSFFIQAVNIRKRAKQRKRQAMAC